MTRTPVRWRVHEVASPPAPAGPVPWWAALPLSAGAGAAMLAAFPPLGAWPLAAVGVAALAVAVHRRGVRAGAGLGLLAGLTLFLPLLAWTNLHVGVLPWLLLAVSQAAFIAVLGAAGGYASRLVDRHRWVWPVLVAALWVAQEAARDRVPFGGFPWGRLAFSQANGPLLRYAAWGGAPLVTFMVALAGGALAAALTASFGDPGSGVDGSGTATVRTGRRAAGWHAPAAALLVVATVLLGGLVPVSGPAGVAVAGDGAGGARPAGTAIVAVVQGNVPRLGLDFNAQRRAVLDNHVTRTLELASQVASGRRPRPDLVVWPENSSDIDPLENPDAAARIDEAATAIGAPILVGTVLDGPGDRVRNAALVWPPNELPSVAYVKRHPVPFAEYIPLRSVARLVSDKVDLVARDFVAGHRPGVVRTGVAGTPGIRPLTIGDVICFEVAYDSLVRDTVTGGGRLLVVQTNNATFNVAEASQQLAMVRLRAVEHARPALMASTVGVSAFVDERGRVYEATHFNAPAVIVGRLRAHGGRTLATTLGAAPELGLTVLALAGLVWAGAVRRGQTAGSQPRRPQNEETA